MSAMTRATVICAELVEWSAQYQGEKFHAVLSDPPYLISFMGKEFDSQHANDNQLMQGKFRAWGEALLPLLHPGALVFMFGSTRTWHRLAAGMEDAGFEIFDTISFLRGGQSEAMTGGPLLWIHGQGFP